MNTQESLKTQLREQYRTEARENVLQSYESFQEANRLEGLSLPVAGTVIGGLVAIVAPLAGLTLAAISGGIGCSRYITSRK